MTITRIAGTLWVVAGIVFLFLGFGATPRNTSHVAIGVVFVILGAMYLGRGRGVR